MLGEEDGSKLALDFLYYEKVEYWKRLEGHDQPDLIGSIWDHKQESQEDAEDIISDLTNGGFLRGFQRTTRSGT